MYSDGVPAHTCSYSAEKEADICGNDKMGLIRTLKISIYRKTLRVMMWSESKVLPSGNIILMKSASSTVHPGSG